MPGDYYVPRPAPVIIAEDAQSHSGGISLRTGACSHPRTIPRTGDAIDHINSYADLYVQNLSAAERLFAGKHGRSPSSDDDWAPLKVLAFSAADYDHALSVRIIDRELSHAELYGINLSAAERLFARKNGRSPASHDDWAPLKVLALFAADFKYTLGG